MLTAEIGDAERRKALSKSMRDICSQRVDAAFDIVCGDLLHESVRAKR
jgi:hypothetical protein